MILAAMYSNPELHQGILKMFLQEVTSMLQKVPKKLESPDECTRDDLHHFKITLDILIQFHRSFCQNKLGDKKKKKYLKELSEVNITDFVQQEDSELTKFILKLLKRRDEKNSAAENMSPTPHLKISAER